MPAPQILFIATSGEQGSGKTTATRRIVELLADYGIAADQIYCPKFADPLYDAMYWFTAVKHRRFLQEIGDVLRGHYGEGAIVDSFRQRVDQALKGSRPQPPAPPAGWPTVGACAYAICSRFVYDPAGPAVAATAAVIRRHFSWPALRHFLRRRALDRATPAQADLVCKAILCDDMRKGCEYDALKELGAVLVRIDCAEAVREARCRKDGTWTPVHGTEGQLIDHAYDHRLDNSGADPAELYRQLDPLVHAIARAAGLTRIER